MLICEPAFLFVICSIGKQCGLCCWIGFTLLSLFVVISKALLSNSATDPYLLQVSAFSCSSSFLFLSSSASSLSSNSFHLSPLPHPSHPTPTFYSSPLLSSLPLQFPSHLILSLYLGFFLLFHSFTSSSSALPHLCLPSSSSALFPSLLLILVVRLLVSHPSSDHAGMLGTWKSRYHCLHTSDQIVGWYMFIFPGEALFHLLPLAGQLEALLGWHPLAHQTSG